LLLAQGAASAHAADDTGAAHWLAAWTFEPWVVALLATSLLLYGTGVARLWQRAGIGRGVGVKRVLLFAGGWLLVVLALVSPLDALGAQLFSAHMVQHEVLMAAAAPLLVMSRPLGAWIWAFPPAARRRIGQLTLRRRWVIAWAVVTTPLAAWLLHFAALWLWHVPALFKGALHHAGMHTMQHASFLVTALLFWWTTLGRVQRRVEGAALVSLFTTMLHTAALGALLTLSSSPWYSSKPDTATAFGLTALEDQQIGGLVMWIPAGIVYFAAGLAIVARLLSPRTTAAVDSAARGRLALTR
jgi:putative membrane protein